MNGLEQIIAINSHAACAKREAIRASRGLKPADEVGRILRAVKNARPLTNRKSK